VAQVLELAHVARELELHQPLQRVVGDALGVDPQLLRALLQERARQHRDVLAPLAQRRQAQADHVQPVEQVLAEAAGAHALLEVLVRRRDHAHVALQGLVATDAVELAVRQHAQQPRLQVEGHVADLVEKQRAAVGLLEAAAAHGLRAGEGAALVAEEFALEQVLRDRRGVDRDEGALAAEIAARAVAVQRARDQLLAGAALAGDHHRHRALAQAADRAEHVLHRRRLAEHLGHRRGGAVAHLLAQALVHRPPDQLHRLRHVERLGQVFEGAALERGHRAVQVGVRGHDDDRQPGQPLLDPGQQVDARGAGHADVADQHLRRLVVQRGQHLARIGEAAHLQLLARERLLQHEADRVVVVDDPDGFHARRRLRKVAQGNGIRIVKSVRPGTLSNSIVP
jgi:hypothetical protein